MFWLGILIGCLAAIPLTIVLCRSSYRKNRKSAFNLELKKEFEEMREEAENHYKLKVALLENEERTAALKVEFQTKLLDEKVKETEKTQSRHFELQTKIACLAEEYELKAKEMAKQLVTKADAEAVAYLNMIAERKNERFAAIVKNYEKVLAQFFDGLNERKEKAEQELVELLDRIAILRASEITWSELAKDREKAEWKSRIMLDDRSRNELTTLYSICANLSNPTPIYKTIYTYYVSKAMGNLVLLENVEGKCGIYCITNVRTGMRYVGQSVNVGNRWKEHAKRGCGADG
jgi:hypothetical protein